MRTADDGSSHVQGAAVPFAFVNTSATRNGRFPRLRVYARALADLGHAGDALRHSKPMTWHVPLREEVRATFAIDAPLAGYVIHRRWRVACRSPAPARHPLREARVGPRGLEGRGLAGDQGRTRQESFEGRVATYASGRMADGTA